LFMKIPPLSSDKTLLGFDVEMSRELRVREHVVRQVMMMHGFHGVHAIMKSCTYASHPGIVIVIAASARRLMLRASNPHSSRFTPVLMWLTRNMPRFAAFQMLGLPI
jgi:hypothetical protein